MKIIKLGNKYIMDCEYAEREIPKYNGWRWDPEMGKWWTDDLRNVKMVQLFDIKIDSLVLNELKELKK
jgi:hypothetical protein